MPESEVSNTYQEDMQNGFNKDTQSPKLPKKGDRISYKEKNGNIWYKAVVLGRTSKRNVKKNVHFNIDREQGGAAGIVLENYDWRIEHSPGNSFRYQPSPSVHSQIEYDDSQIENAEVTERENESFVVFIPRKDWDKPFVVEAKEKEIANFNRYGAYKVVPDEGQPRLPSGWIITEKLY